jgi:hypothetical protein
MRALCARLADSRELLVRKSTLNAYVAAGIEAGISGAGWDTAAI